MQLQTIEMERGAARDALRCYRRDVKEAAERRRGEADRELAAIDSAVMRGYRELGRGHRLLELSKTIAAGGVKFVEATASYWNNGTNGTVTGTFDVALPALAAIRASASTVWMLPTAGSRIVYRADDIPRWHFDGPRKADRLEVEGAIDFEFEYGAAGYEQPAGRFLSQVAMRALVPTIPPAFRPRHALAGYVILFEAEWSQATPPAPVDPALLKHLGGDLYAVLAVWNLSPLERVVLAGARS